MNDPCNNTKYGKDAICECGHRKGDHSSTLLDGEDPCECGHCGTCLAADNGGVCDCMFFSEDVDASIEVNEDSIGIVNV
jgi:hypothetical protein